MANINVTGLAKAFGSVMAVDDFNLSVENGEFVALLGPSGCGKTTVMRLIAGIAEPGRGQIFIGGRDMANLPPERRNVGLVFQSYALFPHMTVAGNVGFGLKMRGVRGSEADKRVADALALVDLGGYGTRFPRQLSGGQQQRVALARALAFQPDVLLLDEPLSNLDAKLRQGLREELRALLRRLGITSIYVTHDQEEAIALADRIVVMNAGRIVEIGPPEALYRTPRTRFAAEFLGHSNLIALTVDGGGLRLPWGALFVAPADARMLCVRPEELLLAADPNGPGRVVESTFLGSDTIHRVEIAGCHLKVRQSGRSAEPLAAGTTVSIRVPADAHLLAA